MGNVYAIVFAGTNTWYEFGYDRLDPELFTSYISPAQGGKNTSGNHFKKVFVASKAVAEATLKSREFQDIYNGPDDKGWRMKHVEFKIVPVDDANLPTNAKILKSPAEVVEFVRYTDRKEYDDNEAQGKANDEARKNGTYKYTPDQINMQKTIAFWDAERDRKKAVTAYNKVAKDPGATKADISAAKAKLDAAVKNLATCKEEKQKSDDELAKYKADRGDEYYDDLSTNWGGWKYPTSKSKTDFDVNKVPMESTNLKITKHQLNVILESVGIQNPYDED